MNSLLEDLDLSGICNCKRTCNLRYDWSGAGTCGVRLEAPSGCLYAVCDLQLTIGTGKIVRTGIQ